MSNTKRRTRGDHGWVFDNYYTPRIDHEVSFKNGIVTKEVKILTKKEAKKKLAKFHSDAGNGRTSGRHKLYSHSKHEDSLRNHSNTELLNYEKDEEHEVQITTKKYLRDWWN